MQRCMRTPSLPDFCFSDWSRPYRAGQEPEGRLARSATGAVAAIGQTTTRDLVDEPDVTVGASMWVTHCR